MFVLYIYSFSTLIFVVDQTVMSVQSNNNSNNEYKKFISFSNDDEDAA